MYKSANYAQIRCTVCSKVIHIEPDIEFKGIECDCKKEEPKPKSRAKPKPKES